MSIFKQKKNSGKHGYSSFSKSNKTPKISFNHLDDTMTLSFEDDEKEEPISVAKPDLSYVKKEVVKPQEPIIPQKIAEVSKPVQLTKTPFFEKTNENTAKFNYSNLNKIVTNEDKEPENNHPTFDGNDTLLISERESKVLLPYSNNDINTYLTEFSNKYSTAKEVIDHEFTYSLKYFSNFSRAARFREAFALYRDREGRTTFESIAFAFKTMKISNLQPAVIAACRSERVFKDYLEHLENNDLENFKYFKIEYKLSPSVR